MLLIASNAKLPNARCLLSPTNRVCRPIHRFSLRLGPASCSLHPFHRFSLHLGPAPCSLHPTHPYSVNPPFQPHRGGKLRTSEFAVADKGPRQGVLPEWVPQLQLHMLCAGETGGEQGQVHSGGIAGLITDNRRRRRSSEAGGGCRYWFS